MKIISKLALTIAASTALSGAACAGEQTLWPLNLNSVAVIGVATGGHASGNVEINVGYVFHALGCADRTYFTTKLSSDADRAMLALLRTAKETSRLVSLRISDAGSLTAFPGRCSVVAVELL